MNLPNFLSLVRIALVPIFFILLIQPAHFSSARWWALGVYSAASLTDALDGYLARLKNQVTDFGEWIDPLADKLLILSGILAIYITEQPVYVPPHWIAALIVFREMVFTGGLVTFTILKKKMPASPNLVGKATTVLQIIFILGCLCGLPESVYAGWTAALFTLVSGIVYTWRGSLFLSRRKGI